MKYPWDIVSIVRTKTFSVEAHFSIEQEESPLKVFSGFSRFVFTAIQDSKAATANLHIDDLPGIAAKSNYAFTKYMDSQYSSGSPEELSIGFTTRFKAGQLKGKSPVEVLVENGEKGKEILNGQYKWLKENLSRFPDNKKLMDAIIDASNADLSLAPKSNSLKPVIILDIGCRPLIRKKREDGKCFCYECKIIFDASRNYPVSVNIQNYYAPVVKKDNGMLNVVLKDKDKGSELSNSFDMTAEEWMACLDEMTAIRDDFRVMNRKNALKMAEDADKANRANSKKPEQPQ